MIDKAILKRLAFQDSWSKRIRFARQANDCKNVPKVKDAGKVINLEGAPIQVMHNGVKIFAGCYHGTPMTKIIKILKGHHEPQEEKIFHEVLKHVPDNGVMIEVGSFWAYYSLWFSHEKPQRRNFLIEPVEWKRLIGQLNFTLNNKKINVDPYYIQDPAQSLEESTGAGTTFIKSAKPIIIDDYLKEKQLERVDVLHADIQGAEISMLSGAEQAIKDNIIDYLFISTHGDKHQPCMKILKNNDYKILVEHSPQKSFSEDGLIVAAGKNAPYKDKIEIECNVMNN